MIYDENSCFFFDILSNSKPFTESWQSLEKELPV